MSNKPRFEEVLNLPHDKSLRTEYQGIVIDSCSFQSDPTLDTWIRETAISYDGINYTVLETYKTYEDLQVGHIKWVEAIKEFALSNKTVHNTIQEKGEN